MSDATFDRAVAAPGAKPLHVLVISGGGSNGAWGAGYLAGWGERGDRPAFDVIVGLSTGALMATAVLTGDDAALERCYTQTRGRDLYEERCFLLVPFSSSLRTTAPLQRLLERYLTNAAIDKVAEIGQREGRRIYAVTMNLDSGKLVVWDLSAIASDRADPGHYELYREVVRASAAVPVIFEPVELGGRLHVDGGEWTGPFLRDYLLRGGEMKRVGAGDGPAGSTLHLILNGRIKEEEVRPASWIVPLAMRGAQVLMRSLDLSDLAVCRFFADQLQCRFRFCCIPPEIKPLESMKFNPQEMAGLFEQGRQRGRAGWWAGGAEGP